MQILHHLLATLEELLDDLSVLPPVEAVRPAVCPLCGKLAFTPGEGRMGIVGHGSYLRQVLGIASAATNVVARIRRYFCRGHEGTISVLPDVLYPGRWYGAGVILEALRLHLIEGRSEPQVRKAFDVQIDSGSWRTLRRWRKQLLSPLFGWLAAGLGAHGPAQTRAEGRRRLQQLLALAGAGPGFDAAPLLLTGTVHAQGVCWPLGHDPPENLRAKSRPD